MSAATFNGQGHLLKYNTAVRVVPSSSSQLTLYTVFSGV
jgi:hypothetical protein